MKKLLILSILAVGLAFGAYAQGSGAAPDFTLSDAVSGKAVSLADYKGQKAVVLIFTSNHCPYSRLYEDRVNQLINQYKNQGIAFMLINPNDPQQIKEDSEEAMKQKALSWGNGVPYLSDKQQVVAKQYGATKTPEVYVLTPRGGGFTVFYSGAIDDNPQVATDVNQPYLQQALDGVLSGKTIMVKNKRPVGCMIKIKE